VIRRRPPAWALLLAALVALGAQAPARASVPINAPSFIVIQPTTGDVVASRNASSSRPIASTTKMMTALLTIEHARLSDRFRVANYNLSPGESTANLPAGAKMRVADLLRALLLPSANEAAVTLAIGVSGSQASFVRRMNRRAKQLGLRHTHYGNPIGLDVGDNHSSAKDLVKLARVMRTKPFLKSTMNLRRATLKSGPVGRVVVNRNSLVQQIGWVNGVKTGHTSKAGYVLVASGTRNGVPVISAVLDAPSEEIRNRDSLTLLQYAASRYRNALVVKKGHRVARVPLAHRSQTVGLVASRSVRRVIRRGEHTTLRIVGIPREIDGPLKRGTRRGTLLIRYRGRTVDRVALLTEHTVAAATLDEQVDDVIPGGIATIVIILGLGGGGTLLVLGVRRRRRRRAARGTSRRPSRQETGVA
jgi:serine-type D-Ala-D-Ala carboxypeptidase (penicillin-binding protein 5/6)